MRITSKSCEIKIESVRVIGVLTIGFLMSCDRYVSPSERGWVVSGRKAKSNDPGTVSPSERGWVVRVEVVRV